MTATRTLTDEEFFASVDFGTAPGEPTTEVVEKPLAAKPKLAAVPTNEPRLTWALLSSFEMRSPEYIAKPFWQRAAFHLVVGAKNAGKGTYLAGLAARFTRGQFGDHKRVIWIACGEDSHSIDVRPRIEAAGGDPSLIVVVERGRVKLPEDVEEIRRKAKEIGDVGLIVIDPVSGTLASGRSSNADVDVREALEPLNHLADDLDCVVVGVRHLGKDRSRGALSSVLGSVEWVNVPRAVLAIAVDDEDDDLRHVQVIAGNRVRKGEVARSFRITGKLLPGLTEEVTLSIGAGESAKDVESLLATLPTPRAAKKSSVKDMILRELAGGPQPIEALKAKAAAEAGASSDTTWRAANELKAEGKVESKNSGPGTKWYWRLLAEAA